MISESRRVLDFAQNDGGVVWFDQPDHGGETDAEMTQLQMPEADWLAFGSPERITVTIVAGDLLNIGGTEVPGHATENVQQQPS